MAHIKFGSLLVFVLVLCLGAPAPAAHPRAVTAPPETLIGEQTQRVLTILKRRPIRDYIPGSMVMQLSATPSKAGFLDAVYAHSLVAASWATEMLADKRIFDEVLIRELGNGKAHQYYPKTIGLREFLVQHGFLDANGDIKKDEADTIESTLYDEFPSGFVVRAAVGVAPQETTKGLFADTDQFMVELMKPRTPLYEKTQAHAAVTAHLLGNQVASGEAVVLQENLTAVADAKKPLKRRFFQEVRIHTYENRVVADAVPTRWVQKELLDPDQIEKAEHFVQDFLGELSTSVTSRQAWGVDVAVFDNGEMRINDVVTNRGTRGAWSSYLEQPRVIEAYVRHLENFAGVHFAGLSGWLMRHGFANYFTFWGKRIEKAHGFDKLLAYLPPWP